MGLIECDVCAVISEFVHELGKRFDSDRKKVLCENIKLYAPGKCTDDSAGFIAFDSGGTRIKTRTGRFLVKRLNLNSDFLNDTEIEKLSFKINSLLYPDMVSDSNIKILTGADITDAYEKSIGSSSCMTGSNSNYTKMYEQNPKIFRLVIARTVKNSARALLSKLDNGLFLLDRIYSDSSGAYDILRSFGKSQKWLYSESGCVYDFNGKECSKKDITVSAVKYINGNVPYMDSLKYADYVDDNTLNLRASYDSHYDVCLETTNGYINDDNTDSCSNCNESFYTRNLVRAHDSDNHYCENCASDCLHFCENCENDIDGDITTVFSRRGNEIMVCSDCYESDYTRCDNCGDVHHNSNIVQNGDNSYCLDCNLENLEIENAKKEVESE